MMNEIEKRLETLEREGRRWRVMALGSVALLGAVALAGAAGMGKIEKVIRAERFEVVDAAGNVRALLAVDKDGMAALKLADAAGMARAELSVENVGPKLGLYDAAGRVIFQEPR